MATFEEMSNWTEEKQKQVRDNIMSLIEAIYNISDDEIDYVLCEGWPNTIDEETYIVLKAISEFREEKYSKYKSDKYGAAKFLTQLYNTLAGSDIEKC